MSSIRLKLRRSKNLGIGFNGSEPEERIGGRGSFQLPGFRFSRCVLLDLSMVRKKTKKQKQVTFPTKKM